MLFLAIVDHRTVQARNIDLVGPLPVLMACHTVIDTDGLHLGLTIHDPAKQRLEIFATLDKETRKMALNGLSLSQCKIVVKKRGH